MGDGKKSVFVDDLAILEGSREEVRKETGNEVEEGDEPELIDFGKEFGVFSDFKIMLLGRR